ncbi:MAG: MoxR family ATPase [Coprothermobacterota bacterium]|nr:MoxR family ATPase [Coprothermobacterota bacterium]
MTPEQFSERLASIRREVEKAIVGQEEVVRQLLLCLVAQGHALIEGVPGLGKTLMVRSLAQALSLRFSRIQFTPDLMPADITGTLVLEEEAGKRQFRFQEGPVFANLVLADEVNRATPKTQSALLEAMQESTVTVARTTHLLPRPFYVFATQNPIEMEGTYPLPEAQLDRFFLKILIEYPTDRQMIEILNRTTGLEEPAVEAAAEAGDLLAMHHLAREVPVAQAVYQYAVELVESTRPQDGKAGEMVRRFVRFGASPRGAQALIMAGKVRALSEGRFHVSREDLRQVASPTLRHRLLLNYEAQVEGISADQILGQVISRLGD